MNTIKLTADEFNKLSPGFLSTLRSVLVAMLLFLIIYYLINIGNRYIDRSRRIEIDLINIIRIFLVIVFLYIVKIIFNKFPIIADTFWAMILAIVISFAINPIVTYLEKKNIKRGYGIIIIYISALLIFTILLVIVIPKTVSEMSNIILRLQDAFEVLNSEALKLNSYIKDIFSYDLPTYVDSKKIFDSIQKSITDYIIEFQSQALFKIRNLATSVGGLVSKIIRFALIFIFTFYFTIDKNKFKAKVVRALPEKHKADILYISNKINQALLDFVKGRVLMAVFVGLITMIYLLILGVDFAIVIGIITCIADIIPYIGPFLGFLPAVLFAFIDSPTKALWVSVLFVLVQWAENNILGPKLLSNKTGLSPILILISIIVGGATMGVFGMIFSVPIASIIVILIDFAKLKYNEKNKNVV
ncbi:AI-2E family transporter [Peptoniphilus catoniae]|uniref:AI-2E family transporter n=1 Tax=Peptoniphilus catoniae TaxID=1660341 RepID=UPI0010FF13A4|nr:AI-2E family transporter [Peptoniphilus catoniae]